MNLIINAEDYFCLLMDLFDLEIWYAKQLSEVERCPLPEAIHRCTEIYHYSTEYKPCTPAEKNLHWHNVVSQIAMDLGNARQILSPYIKPRVAADLEKLQDEIRQSYNGFMYEFRPEYHSDSKEDFLTLHFRNYFAPDSPFEHNFELRCGLHNLLKRAKKERPDVKQVQCASWLNNLPKFLALFPPQWDHRANVCWPMLGSSGWWGRFIDRRGHLNQKAVAEFKATKTFSAPNRHCRCAVEELYDHVSE